MPRMSCKGTIGLTLITAEPTIASVEDDGPLVSVPKLSPGVVLARARPIVLRRLGVTTRCEQPRSAVRRDVPSGLRRPGNRELDLARDQLLAAALDRRRDSRGTGSDRWH